MARHLEIERKYKILPSTSLEPLLEKFFFEGSQEIVDEYFDTFDGKYYQNGIFVRIRNGRSLDIKFNPDHLGKKQIEGYVYCHEYNFHEPFAEKDLESFRKLKTLVSLSPPQGTTFRSFLESNALVPLVTIDKVRKTYKTSLYTCVLDEIKEFGRFLELEYSGAEDKEIEDVVASMDLLMKDILVEPLTAGTFEVLLKQANPELYLKGKYKLAKDQEV